MHTILLKEMMRTPVVTVNINDPFSRVENEMRLQKVRHLPVLDDQGRVVGIISQRDLYRALSPRQTLEGDVYDPGKLDEFLLARVMTSPVTTLGPEDPLGMAVSVMAEYHLGCIPLVDKDRKIVGILTKTDILRFLARVFKNA